MNNWKIIHTDNFGGDYPDEKFVTEIPPLTEKQAKEMAKLINSFGIEHSSRYYREVPNDYKLEPGFTP